MKNLKKKISIILFKDLFKKYPYIFIFSKSLLLTSNKLNTKILSSCTYLFTQAHILDKSTSNLVFTPHIFKKDLVLTVSILKTFFCLKVHNIYFFSSCFKTFNYLKLLTRQDFLLKLKTLYSYFIKFILYYKKLFFFTL